MQKNSIRHILISTIVTLSFALSGCQNFLEEAADKETKEARLFEARRLMNERKYTEAIAELESLDATALASRDVATLRASAYAGRCGLDFIKFVDRVQNVGTTTLLALFLNVMKDATSYTDCVTAETTLKTVGATGTTRSSEENLLMAFIGFAKIGAILAAPGNADNDNDGVADVGFNACQSLTRAEGAQIGTGIALAIESLENSGSDLFGAQLGDFDTLCTTVFGAGGCSTNVADYDNTERDAIRTIVHDNDGTIGLGTQDPDTDPVNDVCTAEGT